MQLHFPKHKKHISKEHTSFNPHIYWIWLLCLGVILLTAELLYFSWFFLETTKVLDAPALPTLETNSVQINRMQQRLDTVEKAINQRTGSRNQ